MFIWTCSSCFLNTLRLKSVRGILLVRFISRSEYQFPELLEKDLEEHFIHGHGPGGSRVNQSNNCVLLKHIPTGVFVRVHESRSLDANRKTARQHLVEKLDFHLNGENSYLALKQKERIVENARSDTKRQKLREKRLELRKLLKSFDDDDTT